LNSKIRRVLAKLEYQSKKERDDKVEVAPDQQMLAITVDTGMFFSILLKAVKARRILEVGTSAGYSTIWFADALMATASSKNASSSRSSSNKPHLITIEENGNKVKRARKNFQQAGVDDFIELLQGSALDVLGGIKKKDYFDFVFLDADKENLVRYLDLVLPMIRVGGIVAADNMLYPEQYRPWMKKYVRHIRSKPNLQTVTLPIGMGEEITIRIE
jgi:predicted O-methyltransferase YrrM